VAKKITIRFYEELNDFLPASKRKKDLNLQVSNHQNIKDIIESLNIPHIEVDLILSNGKSVNFQYRPKEGDRFSVYPVFESFNIADVTHLRPEPLRNTLFILDVHLGKLARYLRMIGYDTYYRNDLEDNEIVSISIEENRIILTRDIQLLKNSAITHGYFVRDINPEKQLREIIGRFNLDLSGKLFSICMECNGRLKQVEKKEIEHRLEPGTQRCFNEFYLCQMCEKIYWPGSHYEEMKRMIDKL
jgi:uncharacterized protein with PIN domain